MKYFLEWFAGIAHPRFRLYRNARQSFEAYCAALDMTPDGPSPQQQEAAKRDAGLQEAEKFFREAIRLSKAAHAYRDVAAGWYELGMLFNLQGRWSDALRALIDALLVINNLYGGPPDPSRPWAIDIMGKVPRLNRDAKRLFSGCYFQIGLAYLKQDMFKEAKEDFETSLKIDLDLGDPEGQSLCRIGIRKCDDALEERKKKSKVDRVQVDSETDDNPKTGGDGEQRSDTMDIPLVFKLAEYARAAADYEASRAFYNDALEIARANGVRNGEALCLFGLAEVARATEDYKAARELYHQALAIFRETGKLNSERLCQDMIDEIEQGLGR
jgi:tetratricopeptide (TPR) repeat protein